MKRDIWAQTNNQLQNDKMISLLRFLKSVMTCTVKVDSNSLHLKVPGTYFSPAAM